MTALSTKSPFTAYNDLNGDPLSSGFVYYGVASQNPETNPITVYWDAAATQPAAQPIQTLGGYTVRNGTPAVVYAPGDYSLTVRNQYGAIVFYAPSSSEYSNDLVFQSFITNLAGSGGSSQVGFLAAGAGAQPREVQDRLRDTVHIFDYMTPAIIADVLAGTKTIDVSASVAAAQAVCPDVYFPNGTYWFGTGGYSPSVLTGSYIGQSRKGVIFTRSGAGPIITLPYLAESIHFKNLFFTGSGNTGITVASTAGAFQGYAIKPHIEKCDFAWELAAGINFDAIYMLLEQCSFSYFGTVGSQPAPGAGTMQAIIAAVYPATANFTNLNTVRKCIFIACGSLTIPAISLSGATSWLFEDNDYSYGGVVLNAINAQLVKFKGTNWIEGNAATNALMVCGTSLTNYDFDGVNVTNNTCDRVWQFVGGSTKGLIIRNSLIGMNSPSYVLFDATTLSRLLPADGSVQFFDNVVSGGNALNKVLSSTEFRGGTSPRARATCDTTGSGSILGTNDAGMTISRTGTGNVTLTFTHPIAPTTAKALVTHGTKTGQAKYSVTSTTSVGMQLYDITGAAVDGIFTVECGGAP